MPRSTMLVSSSMRPSSRKRVSPCQWFKPYRISSAIVALAETRVSWRSSQALSAATSGLLRSWRTARRSSALHPRIVSWGQKAANEHVADGIVERMARACIGAAQLIDAKRIVYRLVRVHHGGLSIWSAQSAQSAQPRFYGGFRCIECAECADCADCTECAECADCADCAD